MAAGGIESTVSDIQEALAHKRGSDRPIDASTSLYAVIGNPVGHSLSPVMHNAAFSATGINGVYVALRVIDLKGAMAGVRSLDIAGASVTIPHKAAVIDFLDVLDPAVKAIGAVNTVVNQNRKLVGYNTDGLGAVRALTEKTSLHRKRVTVIGAGGAARAIGHAVVAAGANVTITNRTRAHGEALAEDLAADFLPLGTFTGDTCDVLINTTPVGMAPHIDAIPIDDAVLRPDMIVMDAVYNPLETKLLQAAHRAGCQTVSGVDMFVYQGAAQFELWTQTPAPVELMRMVVLRAL